MIHQVLTIIGDVVYGIALPSNFCRKMEESSIVITFIQAFDTGLLLPTRLLSLEQIM